MTPLRQRMVEAMVTRGFAARTQEIYVEAISRLARHYHRSPALLSKDEVSAYLLDMVSTRHLSYSTMNQAACAARFLYAKVGTKGPSNEPDDQPRWHTPARKPDFLFPVRALSKVFRGKFMATLAGAHQRGHLERDPQGQPAPWREHQRQLYQHDWVVCAKTPLGGPAQVLDYLSRYTHRTAIGNERIKAVTPTEVVFTVRADDKGGKRTVRLNGPALIRRFMLHVLPTGIKRIRHYGVLASACKGARLAQARLALQMPLPNPQTGESARAFMARVAKVQVLQCPCCAAGRLRVVASLQGVKQLPAPGTAAGLEPHVRAAAQPRGPP